MGGTADIIAQAVEASNGGFEAARAAADGEQMALDGLFDRPISINGRKIEAEQLDAIVEQRARRGRPKGAQNKATREWREWWLSKGVDPVTDAIRWLQVGPEILASYLGCTKGEAWDRLQRLREFVAPYLFARMAQTDDQGRAVPLFELKVGGGIAGADGQELPPWLAFEARAQAATPIEQNQGVGAPPDGESQNGESQK